jgi:hypothetical protein
MNSGEVLQLRIEKDETKPLPVAVIENKKHLTTGSLRHPCVFRINFFYLKAPSKTF